MPSDPPDPDLSTAEGLEIDIDPELIAAAVSSVQSLGAAKKRKKKATFMPSRHNEEVGDPETVDLEVELGLGHESTDDLDSVAAAAAQAIERAAVRGPPPPPPAAEPPLDGERALLQLRLRDATDRLRRVEAELLRTAEQRDAAERAARELREAGHRMQADAEAARMRARKEREEVERSAEERVLRGLLDVVENIERGLTHARQDPARVQAGLTMVAEQFTALLRKLSVERIDAGPGTLFDPALHEALLHMPTAEVLPGCIVNEVSAGFLLRGRMIRPSRVVVASAPPTDE